MGFQALLASCHAGHDSNNAWNPKFSDLTHSTETDYDRITGFVVGEDKIDLSGLGYTGVVLSGADEGELRLVYSAGTDRTYVRDDHGPFEFYLQGNYTSTLTDSDFIFS